MTPAAGTAAAASQPGQRADRPDDSRSVRGAAWMASLAQVDAVERSRWERLWSAVQALHEAVRWDASPGNAPAKRGGDGR